MKVIVAGLPKTGTKSMRVALKKLGYSVYDYPDNSYLLTNEYAKIVREGWETEDFRRMYENIDAVLDTPAFYFWDEIHKAFPDAKIILTMRNDEDEWLRSLEKQYEVVDRAPIHVLSRMLSPTVSKSMDFRNMIRQSSYGIRPQSAFRRNTVINKQLAKKQYRQHNAYVIHTAPKDKLLVFKCSEGWSPLCKFLEVPVPDEPFPHNNKGGNMVETVKEDYPIPYRKIRNEIIMSSLKYSSVTLLVGVCVYKYGFTGIFRHIEDFIVRSVPSICYKS